MENYKKFEDRIISSYNEDKAEVWKPQPVVRLGNYDKVNSPVHYTRGKVEAIEIIEDAVQDALDPVVGMLQAQALKYLLRIWLKENPKEDAEKAQWYLNRLVDNLNCHD